MILALEFTTIHTYTPGVEGITLPVVLTCGGEAVKLPASVDTGASNCMFERKHAELLNLDVEKGERKTFRTATGRLDAFGHLVTMQVLDLFRWLDRIRLGLIDHDGEIYLAAYD